MRRREALALAAALAAMPWRAGAAPAAGARMTLPPGLTLLQAQTNPQVWGATVSPEPRARHALRLFVYAPEARPAGRAGFAQLFEQQWRAEFGNLHGAAPVVHYRGRLPGGLPCFYMGRFFERPGGDMYAVMYLLDLGDAVQFVAASVAPGWDGVNFPAAVNDHGLRTLAQLLFPFLDSLRAPRTPPPAAPLFEAAEVTGRWATRSGGTAGSFADANTGASLGTAVRGSEGSLQLGEDGRYEDRFGMYAFNPAAGTNVAGAQGHAGRWRFDSDVVHLAPDTPNGLDNRRRVAGTGRHADGRRVLVLLNPEGGSFKPLAWVPVWDGHAGVMRWYDED